MQKALGRFNFKGFFQGFDTLRPSGRFMEVGPGPGCQTRLVTERYGAAGVIGLESSPDMVRVAEEYNAASRLGTRVTYTCGAVEKRGLYLSLVVRKGRGGN